MLAFYHTTGLFDDENEKGGFSMGVLDQLSPRGVFTAFEEISAIPRGSGNEKNISRFIAETGKNLGLDVYEDKAYNVIIKKPATPGKEGLAPVILQGHMDMVCEKEPGKDFDFKKDPIQLIVDGDYLRADGTTLGADDGIAVAMMLALLKEGGIEHPPLELVFTADEEAGMGGAMALKTAHLTGRRLINLDSEEEGHLLSCCAGGMKTVTRLPILWREARLGYVWLSFEISGLMGGHSGSDIHLQRANAHQLMGRLLTRLLAETDFWVAQIHGGNMDNAIARSCRLVGCVALDQAEKAQQLGEAWLAEMRQEYGQTEPDMTLTIQETVEGEQVFDQDTAKKAAALLLLTPYGVQTMSLSMPGLVESSNNIGIIRTGEDALAVTCAARSGMESRKRLLSDRLRALAHVLGASYSEHGDYPAWEFSAQSPLRQTMVDCYEKLFGQAPQVDAIHAGLECGLFAKKIPGIDMVSIGPDMLDVHTTKERLSIASVERTWRYLLEILKTLD